MENTKEQVIYKLIEQRVLLGYSTIQLHVYSGVQLRGEGGVLPCPFLKIKKSALILVKKVPIVSILRLNLPFKM